MCSECGWCTRVEIRSVEHADLGYRQSRICNYTLIKVHTGKRCKYWDDLAKQRKKEHEEMYLWYVYQPSRSDRSKKGKKDLTMAAVVAPSVSKEKESKKEGGERSYQVLGPAVAVQVERVASINDDVSLLEEGKRGRKRGKERERGRKRGRERGGTKSLVLRLLSR